jgi:hypothetical protein
MIHHFNGEAWKNYNRVHPQFLIEPRNICVGLYTNEFNPFRLSDAPYSCWLMIFTVYNLPSEVCMMLKFMFLSIVISDFNSLCRNIDVCLQSLIDELK